VSGNENENQLSGAVVAAGGLVLERAGRTVLAASELTVGTGITSLVGPNGSGKSSLLHAIAGLLEPAAGSLRVFGRPPAEVRRRVAYVLQAQHAPPHLPVTVREVVELGRAPLRGAFGRLRRDDREAVRDAIDRLELGRLAGRHLSELSGGERQRAFVAQGIAQGADLLLLDEPTAGLDLASTEQIRRVLADERAAGRAVVVATHDLEDAAAGDHVVLLAGRVVASGTPGEALAREHLQEAYRGRLLNLTGDALLVDDDAHHHHH
jgi:ABC-type Mn2+/Zn2+ transport system ATPase subunit